jgi:hypothetical protein
MTIYKIKIDGILESEPHLVEMVDGDDPVFHFTLHPSRLLLNMAAMEAKSREEIGSFIAPRKEFDVWNVREKFFAIQYPTDALEFFKEFGVWRFSRFDGDEPSIRFPGSWAPPNPKNPLPITFNELIYQRNYFEDALNCRPSDWPQRAHLRTGDRDRDEAAIWEMVYLYLPSGYFDISIVNSQSVSFPGPFIGQLLCYEIQDALRASVLLDWMEGREWPRCQECRRVFKRTSKRPQLYCSARCASRVRQKEFRKRLK